MASSNRLVVEVVGDTSKLTRDLDVAQKKINQFAGKSKIRTTALDSTLADNRRMQAEAAVLADRTAEVSAQQSILASRLAGTALKAGVAGLAVNALGRNLQEAGGNTAKFGNALSDLSSGNIVGFVKGLQSMNDVDPEKLAKGLFQVGDASKALADAAFFSAVGLDKQAAAAKNAAAQIIALNDASVDNTKIRDSTSPGAIAAQTSGLSTSRKKRPGISAAQRNTFFDNDITRELDRAQDLNLPGQVSELKRIATQIQARIAATKDVTRKLNLEDQLAAITRSRRGVQGTIADNAAAAARQREIEARDRAAKARAARLAAQAREAARIQAIQSRALGLQTPGAPNLRTQLGSLDSRIASGSLKLSPKLAQNLEGARKILSGKLGKITEETRDNIAKLLDVIRGDDPKTGPLTKETQLNSERILAGLGLGRDQERLLRARLSHFNSAGVARPGAGAGSTAVTVVIDGKPVAQASAKYNRRVASLNPPQRNGPHPGGRGYF